MFTANEFRSIREKCPELLETLLNELNVKLPNFEKVDEFEIYKNLDEEISNRLCEFLKSNDVISGYINLLEIGKVSFDFSQSEKTLLRKIIDAETDIRNACNIVPDEEIFEPEEILPVTKKIEIPLPNLFEAMYLLRNKNENFVAGIQSTKVTSIKIVIEYESSEFVPKRSKPIEKKSSNDDLKNFSDDELNRLFDILKIINTLEEKI